MKKSDIIMISFITIVSLVISYLVLNSIFSGSKKAREEVGQINVIKDSIESPQETVFHKDAINPAVQVFIGTEKPTTEDSKKPTTKDKTPQSED